MMRRARLKPVAWTARAGRGELTSWRSCCGWCGCRCEQSTKSELPCVDGFDGGGGDGEWPHPTQGVEMGGYDSLTRPPLVFKLVLYIVVPCTFTLMLKTFPTRGSSVKQGWKFALWLFGQIASFLTKKSESLVLSFKTSKSFLCVFCKEQCDRFALIALYKSKANKCDINF